MQGYTATVTTPVAWVTIMLIAEKPGEYVVYWHKDKIGNLRKT